MIPSLPKATAEVCMALQSIAQAAKWLLQWLPKTVVNEILLVYMLKAAHISLARGATYAEQSHVMEDSVRGHDCPRGPPGMWLCLAYRFELPWN